MKNQDGQTLLELECHSVELKGCDTSLVWWVHASREKRNGQWEQYDLRLKCCRWSIQKIARQIATMHERDRERLQRELQRIEFEAAAIKQPETK